MARTRLSVLLAHLVLGFAFAFALVVAASGGATVDRQPSAAKRLGLRPSDPLMRRSPDTHFMRFGRSGGGNGGGGDGLASKVEVKREAGSWAAVDGSASSPTSSLSCVPDADASGRVVCYTPFNVTQHFLLVTERRGRNSNQDDVDVEQQPESESEQEAVGDEDDDDSKAEAGDDVDNRGADDRDVGDDRDDVADGRRADKLQNDGRNQTARRSKTRNSSSAGQRFGRSTASDNQGEDAFARFGRRHDNFMRLGRAAANKNDSPLRRLVGRPDLDADYVAILAGDKRGSQNFIRFGRQSWPEARQSHSGDGGGEDDHRTSGGESPEGVGQREAFARTSRHGPGDMNQLRFGRSGQRIGARVARRHDNFMRLGRSAAAGGTNLDLDMFRETRRRDSFLRLGRGGGASASAGR